jgi:formylglycine-generating enzyme required for sulfatase activity
VSTIFISHSSADNAEAIALRDWLVSEGWDDLFLDLDTDRGIAAGERWERALNEAARRCEAVLFLVSRDWLSSAWCRKELYLAHRLNKRIFGILIEDLSVEEIPKDLAGEWQLVRLASGRDHVMQRVLLPVTQQEVHVTFSAEGLKRLKYGLEQAGLDARYFSWPPAHDPKRAPYRGLKPLEADDAGIFFGREAPTIEAIQQLRGMRAGAPPRLLVILGASGAGKSSFLRAGLLPRLGREDRTFLPLPAIRPERAAISGETGLLRALEGAFAVAGLKTPRAELRSAVDGGVAKLKPMLATLAETATPVALEGDAKAKPLAIVIAIDQGEELFLAEAQDEARPFLALLRGLLTADDPAIIAIFTIRSDNYERLQETEKLDGVHQQVINLGPMPRGSYAEVIKGPARRFNDATRELKIDEALVQALLTDIDRGGAKDALPLLAFTLERLYDEYHATTHLRVAHYETLGRIGGSIEAAVERAFKAADNDGRIPRDRQARLTLLRRGLIPWLAGIDPDTKAPRRRVARLSEIPAAARPMIDLLVEQRLLSTDVAQDTKEATIEPAHEALLRQWGLLQAWLEEDAEFLIWLDGVKRAARDWQAKGKEIRWLGHSGERLVYAERLLTRPDLYLQPMDREYVEACRREETAASSRRRRARVVVLSLAVGIAAIAGLSYAGLLDRGYLEVQTRKLADIYLPTVLSDASELALRPGDSFQECASCPEMIVVPAGEFVMGSTDDEAREDERPLHRVVIAHQFAVGKFEVTFDQWDACVAHGGCTYQGRGESWGRGRQPMIRTSWSDAESYTRWLSRQTGKHYRLLTEAEWEYVARAGSTGRYSYGNDASRLDEFGWYVANSQGRTQAVGLKKPNSFGLYDIQGNVWEWVQDCYKDDYVDAPSDGSAVILPECLSRVLRGGSWSSEAGDLRVAARYGHINTFRSDANGFRVARTLLRRP